MHPALSDFRIESDAVIKLTLSNGQSYRVSPNDLEQYLSREDVAKIRQALKLRGQFMRRILPPLVMVGLVAGALILGSRDMQQIRALVQPQSAAPVKSQPAKSVQSSSSASQVQPGSAAGGAPAATAGSQASVTTKPQSFRVQATGAAPAGVGRPAASQSPVAQPALAPVTKTVTDVTKPVSKLVGGVLRALP